MKYAVKFGALQTQPLVDADGRLIAESGQATIASRLLALYPGSVLIGPQRRACDGFDMVILDDIDPLDTLVINIDILDTVGVFQRLHRDGAEPKILNFQWINPSTYHHPVNFAAMALAYCFFPTFCSGERTAAEVQEVAVRWMPQRLTERLRIGWADLGVRVERLQERQSTPVPVVLYPAVSAVERKRPELFYNIVSNVQKKTPIQVVARLAQSSLVTPFAMKLGTQRWSSVSPLRQQKADYWADLAKTTAFVATASEESYGLEYVEAMLAGAIGILPKLPWATALVPDNYPYLYDSQAQAEAMLLRAVTEPDQCRAELDALAGGSFTDWIKDNHALREFEQAFQKQVAAWFGE